MYLDPMNLWDATVALPALWWCVVKHVMPLPKPIHLTHARKRLKPRDGPSGGKELAGGCVFGRQLGSFVFVKKEDGEFIYITIITWGFICCNKVCKTVRVGWHIFFTAG